MPDWAEIAFSLNQLSDSEVLLQCSTSPAAEPPHFVETDRRCVFLLSEKKLDTLLHEPFLSYVSDLLVSVSAFFQFI
jgi:hypothetical protein